MQDIAVAVVNYRTPDLTLDCVESLVPARAVFPAMRVLVVDGGSADGSDKRIADGVAARGWGSWVTVLPLTVNGGFAFANNRAVAALMATGPLPPVIALVNPDARVRPGALERMAALLDREPRAGAVGALLIHEDGRPQSSAFRFPSIRSELSRGAATGVIDRLLRVRPTSIDSDVAIEVPWVTGAAVMLRTEALADVGLFDEGFFLYFEETELMRRLRDHGWTVWHEPAALVIHEGGAATQIRDPETGMPRASPMPAYWYQARRRYFTLVHGRAYGLAAGLAWLAGLCWWQLRQSVVPGPRVGPKREIRDLIGHGLWPTRFDTTAAVKPLEAPGGEQPAWLSMRTTGR
ncbi:glycosyltransferase family 2 protein [uncultured Sphingomonas sp.]|uniref:glycosyltransferase family 2 protein n=1 Tax=uncultured Sphingomonas sp. TaxID=158754 RepID=UPI0035CC57A8